jgi:hypothetical protein
MAAPDATPSAAGASAPQPAVVPNGNGFSAAMTEGGAVVWRCPHVHFTDHSARACAMRHIASVGGT